MFKSRRAYEGISLGPLPPWAVHGKTGSGEGDQELAMSRYPQIYADWKAEPDRFWANAASDPDWIKSAERISAQVAGLARWCVGTDCITTWTAVDGPVRS